MNEQNKDSDARDDDSDDESEPQHNQCVLV